MWKPACNKILGKVGGGERAAGAVIDYHAIQEGKENVASKNELPV